MVCYPKSTDYKGRTKYIDKIYNIGHIDVISFCVEWRETFISGT